MRLTLANGTMVDMEQKQQSQWTALVAQLGGLPQYRKAAEYALCAAAGNERCAAAIVDGLYNEDKNVRAGAARLTGKLAIAVAVEPLLQLVSDARQPGRVRKSAMLALGHLPLRDRDVVGALAPLAAHDDRMYRRAAMETLGRWGAPEAGPLLVHGLDDIAWQVRMYAAIGLGELAPTGLALAALGRARRREPHTATAEQMLRTVADLGRDPTLRARAIAVLIDELTDKQPRARPGPREYPRVRACVRGLGELGAHSARDLITACTTRCVGAVQQEVLWANATLAEAPTHLPRFRKRP